jgi:hypothetical protein
LEASAILTGFARNARCSDSLKKHWTGALTHSRGFAYFSVFASTSRRAQSAGTRPIRMPPELRSPDYGTTPCAHTSLSRRPLSRIRTRACLSPNQVAPALLTGFAGIFPRRTIIQASCTINERKAPWCGYFLLANQLLGACSRTAARNSLPALSSPNVFERADAL